jgi:hypothetical protein
MMQRIALASVLALAIQPAIASQTTCTFEGGKAPQYYELEFIGYSNTEPMIVFSSTEFDSGKRSTLQPEHYLLRAFSQMAALVNLEYRNPGNASLPPSFNLVGRSNQTRLETGSTVVDGFLKCAH